MYMIDLPLSPAKLMRFAHFQGHGRARDDDFGYAAHAWLAAALDKLAPRPFRLLESKGGLRMLGYVDQDQHLLVEHARTFAEPRALEVCDWSAVASKPMPDQWPSGRRLGFELRACPVIRGKQERDVFLAALDRAKESGDHPPDRIEVYLDWLVQRMEAAAVKGGDFIDGEGKRHPPVIELLPGAVSLRGFRRVRTLRRSKQNNSTHGKTVERPDVLFTGELTIRDPARFAGLLARGVGRHRAFGFGMLLLRPPRS